MGPAAVRVTTPLGSAERIDGWNYTPALLLSGIPTPGGQITLTYVQDSFDSIFAIWGVPPEAAVDTPPFLGVLGISPLHFWFLIDRWPASTLDVNLDVPADPELSGLEILLQALVDPGLFDALKDGAWSNTVLVDIQ
jgi:hypothetical protein